jgi:hypothetical protein
MARQSSWEGNMGIIMISCPSTGRAVSTEIEMQDVDRLPTVIATMTCPDCGGVHKWTKSDAWLEKGGAYYQKIGVS